MTERLLNAAERFYVVQRGDCLSVIARRLGVPLNALSVFRDGAPIYGRAVETIYPGDLVKVRRALPLSSREG